MTSALLNDVSLTVHASAAATAWLNAFLATGQDEDRPVLFRTLSVEFYANGIQFVACDGTMLFRAYVPKQGTDEEWPADDESPERSVVVMDGEHFALGFVRTLLAASKSMELADLALSIEPAPEQDGEMPLGAEFSAEVLTLRALGQQLHCRLYEGEYVDWRKLSFGIAMADRVDGMMLATRMFSSVGKLRGIAAIECTFTGDERHIVITGDRSFKGILMPMRRKEKEKPEPEETEGDPDQTDALADATIKINGKWVPATKANMERAIKPVVDAALRRSGRDRAAGKDE